MSSSFLVLEGGKTVINLAFARKVSPFLFGEIVCSAVSGLALGDLSGSLPGTCLLAANFIRSGPTFGGKWLP